MLYVIFREIRFLGRRLINFSRIGLMCTVFISGKYFSIWNITQLFLGQFAWVLGVLSIQSFGLGTRSFGLGTGSFVENIQHSANIVIQIMSNAHTFLLLWTIISDFAW